MVQSFINRYDDIIQWRRNEIIRLLIIAKTAYTGARKNKNVLNPNIVNVFDSTSFEKSAEGVWCPHC